MTGIYYIGEALIHRVVQTETHVDLTEYVHVFVSKIRDLPSVAGRVHKLGSNTRKFIHSSSPDERILSITLACEDYDVVSKLREWIGETVFFRDNRGRSCWGTYNQLDQDESYQWPDGMTAVRISLMETSASADVS